MYSAFSGPLDWSDEASDLIGFVATEHFRAVGHAFLARFENTIARNSSGLREYLGSVLQGDMTFGEVWRPSFGLAKRAITSADVADDPVGIATELAAGFAIGRSARAAWSVSLTRPLQLALGRHSVTVASETRFQFRDHHVQVDRQGHAPLTLCANGAPRANDPLGAGIDELPVLEDGLHRVLFANSAYFRERDEQNLPFAVSDDGAAIERAWSDAFNLVRQGSTAYDLWVSNAIHAIVPVQAPNGSMVSGSQGHRPGEVYMTDMLEPTKLAEMLVHEASHQYFQIATFLGSPVTGSDTDLYFSPVVGTHRPLEKILLAYHAFANVILFLEICRAAGVGNPVFLDGNLSRLRREVAELQGPLESTSGLSSLGTSLWQPLAERLARVH